MKFKKGQVPWNKGKTNIYSKETLIKMSNIHRNISDETREKMRESAKYNICKRGSKLSKKTKQLLREANLGKRHTEETKLKMSDAQKRVYNENDNHAFKKDMSGKNNPFYGKIHTNKVKEIISQKLKKTFSDKENCYWHGKKRSKDTRQKISRTLRLMMLEKMQGTHGQIFPAYNSKACEFFNQLNIINGLNGLHAENGGEYYVKELGYWVDYYEPNLNLVIEWDEKKHHIENGELNKKDINRQNEIENLLKCKFIRINESINLSAQLSVIVAYVEILKYRNHVSDTPITTAA